MKELELKRLSICPCGYAVLLDSIPLGTKYRVKPQTLRPGFRYVCGRCKREQIVMVIDASSATNPTAEFRPLPAELFAEAS